MRYRSTYRSRRDRRSSASSGAYGYIMPFLILIALGVIVILGGKLWKMLFGTEQTAAAYIHFVDGSARMKVWGTDSFFDLDSGAIVKAGDEVVASSDAKIIVEFFDGTILRMDGGTDVTFEEISDTGANPELRVLLLEGKLWLNKSFKSTGDTNLVVTMDHAIVKAADVSNFEVESDFDETIRGIHGDPVVVDILSEDDDKVVDSEDVGVGQEIVLNDAVLAKYWQYQSPNVLMGIVDAFKRSEWYLWNFQEDKSPTKFKKAGMGGSGFVEVEPEALEPQEEEGMELSVTGEEEVVGEESEEAASEVENDSESEVEPTPEPEPVSEPEPVDVTLSKPEITSVAGVTETNADGFYVISDKIGTLKGAVEGAYDIEVNGYVLTQFSAGATTWTYFANADYGLMVEGENIFEVRAMDKEGNKSEPLIVKVLYQPAVSEPAPEPAPEAEAEMESSVSA